jgi:hypothetical protein
MRSGVWVRRRGAGIRSDPSSRHPTACERDGSHKIHQQVCTFV